MASQSKVCSLAMTFPHAKLFKKRLINMKKLAIIITLFSLHLSAFAQELTCLDKLLPYNRSSGVHLVSRDEWTDGKDFLDADGAKAAFTFLTSGKLLCKPNEVIIKVQAVCSQILADLPQSNTCFLFSNIGYFIMSRDIARNTSIIFSKDKKFSDQL